MLQKILEERHSKRKPPEKYRTDKNRQKINENFKKNAFYNHINHFAFRPASVRSNSSAPRHWLSFYKIPCGATALTGYNFLVRTLIGQTVTFFLQNKNHFNLENAWLRPKKFEKKFYRVLKVKKWKKHAVTAIPEQFDLETLPLETIVKNMIQAEIVHFIRLSSTKQLKKANWDADDRTSAEPFYLLLQ